MFFVHVKKNRVILTSPLSLPPSTVCSRFLPSVDFVICVCNTAHHFQSYMERGLSTSSIPFLSLVTLTSKRVLSLSTPSSKVAVLGATGCMKSGLYQREMERLGGRKPYVCGEREQKVCMDAIYHVKAGEIDEVRIN